MPLFFFKHQTQHDRGGLERLEVIAENTQIGSGYSSAARSGNARSSACWERNARAIAAVGFHIYSHVAMAVRALKHDKKALLNQLKTLHPTRIATAGKCGPAVPLFSRDIFP
jgi:transcription-repair coupling factor (superfamily II helicase)